jgi:hypothetical protein
MACQTETTQIGDHEYSVTQWPAQKAILMKMRLAKTFGASLASIVANSQGGKKSSDSDDAKGLSEGLNMLFQANSPEEVTSLIKETVVGVSMDGTRIMDSRFDEVFSGDNLMDVYKVFMFVIKVNYGNLLKGQKVEGFLARVQGSL